MSAITKSNTSLVEGKNVLLSEEITIFLFDCSGSMSDRIKDDNDPVFKNDSFYIASKFLAMKDAATRFVQQRIEAIKNGANDSVGIILFGDEVKLLHDPSSVNFESLLNRISKLRCGGGTPMAQAVDLAIQTAERFSSGMIRVVIVSDGQPDYKSQVLSKVQYAFNELGIVFDTIGVGDPTGWGLDEEFMVQVAELGGGEYTRIETYADFSRKFLSIESERQLLIGNGILMLSHDDSVQGA